MRYALTRLQEVLKKAIIGCVIVSLLLILGCSNTTQITENNHAISSSDDLYKICLFNPQIFGESKSSNLEFMGLLKTKIESCDLFFLLEIREKSGESFDEICNFLNGYECFISERDGRTSSKEQIGIFKKKTSDIEVISSLVDEDDIWERSPVLYQELLNSVQWNYYVSHIDPDDVQAELRELEKRVDFDATKPTIILGDLNADCDTYNPLKNSEFDEWYWIVKDEEDTTSGNTDCAYDRILMNKLAYSKFDDYGIDKSFSNMSDHYMVWMTLNR